MYKVYVLIPNGRESLSLESRTGIKYFDLHVLNNNYDYYFYIFPLIIKFTYMLVQ